MENYKSLCLLVLIFFSVVIRNVADESAWTSITSDSTGQYLAAANEFGHIYYSTDFGASFIPTANIGYWTSITSDSSGKYLAAVDRQSVYLSNDTGKTWRKTVSLPACQAIASDSSGNRLVAVVAASPSLAALSSDRGRSWTIVPQTGYFVAVTSDSTGKYLAAASLDGFICISNNFGSTWSTWSQQGSSIPWKDITSDSSGRYLAAVAAQDYIYVSSDYGKNWNQKESSRSWASITSDSSGQRLAAACSGYIYISQDYGNSWTQVGVAASWTAIASDSSGQHLAATASSDGIYLSSDYGNSWERSEGIMAITATPVLYPTVRPTPTLQPSPRPTRAPINPTSQPSSAPSRPTFQPTVYVIPTYCLCLSNAWLSALLVPVLVLFVLSFFLVENKVKVFFIIAIPTLDTFTDLIYVAQNKFVSPLVLSLAIVFLLLPTVGLIHELILVGKMRPSFCINLRKYSVSVALEWREGDPYFLKRKLRPFSELNSSLKTFMRWIGVALIMGVQVLLWIIDGFIMTVLCFTNCIMIALWVLLGCFAFHVKLFSIEVVWENWKAVWTSEPVSQEEISEVINARLINKATLTNLVLETVPHLILQTYNNQILGWDFISQLSTVLSVLMIIQVGYHYLYHMFWKKMSLDEMPSNPYGISVKEHTERLSKFTSVLSRKYSIYRVASDDPTSSRSFGGRADDDGEGEGFSDVRGLQLSRGLSYDRDEKDEEGDDELNL